MPIDGQIELRGATVSETQVYTSRPSGRRVLRIGAPQLRTTSSYAAPCHEARAEPISPVPCGAEAQPETTRTVSTRVSRIDPPRKFVIRALGGNPEHSFRLDPRLARG